MRSSFLSVFLLFLTCISFAQEMKPHWSYGVPGANSKIRKYASINSGDKIEFNDALTTPTLCLWIEDDGTFMVFVGLGKGTFADYKQGRRVQFCIDDYPIEEVSAVTLHSNSMVAFLDPSHLYQELLKAKTFTVVLSCKDIGAKKVSFKVSGLSPTFFGNQ